MIMHLEGLCERGPRSLLPRLDGNAIRGDCGMKIDEKTACIESYRKWAFATEPYNIERKRLSAHIAWTIRQHGRERGWIE